MNQLTVIHMGDVDKNTSGQQAKKQNKKTSKQKHCITLLIYT